MESQGQFSVVPKCGNWVCGRCAKIKRVTARLVMHLVCLKCKEIIKGTVDFIKKLCDEVETVNGFCHRCCIISAMLYGSNAV